MLLIPGILSSGTPAFVPSDIAGLKLWLDASDSGTITLNGSNVSQWDDKSANSYNYTQATATNQPTYTTAGQNGLNCLTFASNDFLVNASINWGASASTLFLVMKETGTGYQNVFTTGGGNTGQWGYGVSDTSSGNKIAIFDIGQGFAGFAGSPTTSNADVLCFTSAGISGSSVTANLFKNGSADASNPVTLTNTTSATGSQIGAASGGGEAYDGTICEVIMYDSQLGTSDRNKVENYLKTKWATV